MQIGVLTISIFPLYPSLILFSTMSVPSLPTSRSQRAAITRDESWFREIVARQRESRKSIIDSNRDENEGMRVDTSEQ